MTIEITKHRLKIGSQSYFRGLAHRLVLAHVGVKRNPVGLNAYVDPEFPVSRSLLEGRVTSGGPIRIEWTDSKKKDVEFNGPLKFLGDNGRLQVNGTWEEARREKLVLQSFAIDRGPLKTMLNDDAEWARKFLKGEGNGGRIVSEVIVLTTPYLAEQFSSDTRLSVAANGSEFDLEITPRTSSARTITISKGTTFAYKLHWVKRWNKDKSQVRELEDDNAGLG